MNTEHRNFLKVNHRQLAQLIDLSQLMVFLIPKKIFTRHMLEDIYSHQTETDRKHNLLLELRTRGPNAFNKFIEALELSGHREATELFKKYADQGTIDVDVPLVTVDELLPRTPPIHADAQALGPTKAQKGSTAHAPSDGSLSELCVKPAVELKVEDEKTYKMTSHPRGFCLLINNVNFVIKEEIRLASDKDAQRLDKVFTDLGYKVIFRTDLEAKQMKTELKKFADLPQHEDCDSSVVIILTHGANNIVFGTDKDPVFISDIKAMFNNRCCPALQEKPKMFFIQACRGTNHDSGVPKGGYDGYPCKVKANGKNLDKADALVRDVEIKTEILETEEIERLPLLTDMLTSYSTVEGNISVRNEVLGSWYCQEIVRVFVENAWNTPLREMLDQVNRNVQKYVSDQGEKGATSCTLDGWNKKLYFNPKL